MPSNIVGINNSNECTRDVINLSTMCVIGNGDVVSLERVRESIDKAHEAIGAIEIVNRLKYGLNASIFSSDFPRVCNMYRRKNVGTMAINDTTRSRRG